LSDAFGRETVALPAAHPWRGYLCIAIATLCWGGSAAFGKAAFSGRIFAGQPFISPLVLSQTRTSISVLLLAPALLLVFGRSILKISSRDLGLCALAGTMGVAGSNFFYYFAIEKTSVAVAITLQYTAPIWVLLYMVSTRRQKGSLGLVLPVIIALAGIALTIRLFQGDARFSLMGSVAALLASFSFALYNIVAQGLVSRHPQWRVMFYVLLSASALWLAVDPPWKLAAIHYSGKQWGFLTIFAVLSMLVPYLFFFTGLKYLDPTRAVVTSCLEPVFAIIFAAVFLHEGLHPLQVAGVLAVLAATVLIQRHGAEPAAAGQ